MSDRYKSVAVTSACDDDIDMADDLVQLDHPESVHAVKERTGSVFGFSEETIYYLLTSNTNQLKD